MNDTAPRQPAEKEQEKKKGRIVIVSGPVGAGKTAVARELVAAAPGPVACIEGDTFWSHLAKGGQTLGRHRNFQTVMRAMTAAAVPYALTGYEVILDFSLPPWFLDTVRRIVGPRGVSVDYIVLRPSEAVCAARATARAQGRITDYAPYHDLYADFDGVRDALGDDTSDAATLAAQVRDGIARGTFRLGP